MSDSLYETYQRYGTNAERLAFVPDPPPTFSGACQPIYLWYETDTGDVYLYFTSWVLIATGSSPASSGISPFLLMGG